MDIKDKYNYYSASTKGVRLESLFESIFGAKFNNNSLCVKNFSGVEKELDILLKNFVRMLNCGESVLYKHKDKPILIYVVGYDFRSKDFGLKLNEVTICYSDEAKGIVDGIISVCDKRTLDKPVIQVVEITSFGTNTYDKVLNPVTLNLDKYYNAQISKYYPKIKEFLLSDKGGIIILHGLPGGGKTNFLRHLITDISGSKFVPNVYYGNGPLDRIIEHTFDYNPILIYEDAEEYISKQLGGRSKLSGILNQSDGLLSDNKNPKLILTINAPLTDIDDAILRKGRLFGALQFDKLHAAKADLLLQELGREPRGEDMTLADIFNDFQINESTESKVIGFR